MFFCFHLMSLWLYPISPINLKFFKGRTCSSVISTAPASFSTEVRIQYIDILVEEIFCMYYRRGYSVRQCYKWQERYRHSGHREFKGPRVITCYHTVLCDTHIL